MPGLKGTAEGCNSDPTRTLFLSELGFKPLTLGSPSRLLTNEPPRFPNVSASFGNSEKQFEYQEEDS